MNSSSNPFTQSAAKIEGLSALSKKKKKGFKIHTMVIINRL